MLDACSEEQRKKRDKKKEKWIRKKKKRKRKRKRKEESEVKSCGWWVLKCVCIYKIAIITLFL